MRRHLCALVIGPAREMDESWRRTWDPVMASVVPAHVTIAYPEETADEALLLRRAVRQLATRSPFRLRLGEVFAEDRGRGGVFLAVDDVEGGWAGLRRGLLAAPMTPVDFPAHVTVAHPRTSDRGEECRAALAGRPVAAEFPVREVLFTETTARAFTVLRRFPLRADRRPGARMARETRGHFRHDHDTVWA